MNTQDPKYQQKSKAISSAEPNYFVHFAMRHPVYHIASNGYNLVRTKFDRNHIKFIIKEPKAYQAGVELLSDQISLIQLLLVNFSTKAFADHQFVSMVSRNGRNQVWRIIHQACNLSCYKCKNKHLKLKLLTRRFFRCHCAQPIPTPPTEI